ncbi:MAG: 2-amino-3,7-dideoxy-D-threo-hept-6-ulosonate synthase [Syntrophobacter sp.]
MIGKKLRLKRIISPRDGRTIIFPLDHGVARGPLPGLERIAGVVDAGIRAGADALVLHKGMLRCLEAAALPLPGIIMHLSASTSLGSSCSHKVLVGGVEEAVRLGADAVSVHINLGDAGEREMLRDLGDVGQRCSEWRIPLLVMAYAVGKGDQVASGRDIAHAARVAAELGADLIKIPFPGDYDALAAITSSLPVPVVVAGGSPPGELEHLFRKVEKSLEAGACGIAAGRSIFQQPDPCTVLAAIRRIVHPDFEK